MVYEKDYIISILWHIKSNIDSIMLHLLWPDLNSLFPL